jgi:DNA-binding transcriptional MocR family regulator
MQGQTATLAQCNATRKTNMQLLKRLSNVFYKDGEHKISFRIGFPSVAGSKINAGLKQIAEATKLFLA